MRMDRFFVRIQKITLKNFKNVKYGTVSLTNPLKKYKASVLGLYGQNGSGKTALIEAIQILKTLLCGASLPEGSENYINVDSDNAQLIFEFCMNDNDSGYAYIVEYSFGLKRVEVDSSNTMDSSNEQAVSRLLCISSASISARVEGAFYAPLNAVIPDASFGQVPQLRGLLYFMTSTHLWSLNKAQRNKIRHVSAFV